MILERNAMINLDSILKSRDITLPTKVHLVKAVVFPAVMCGCESSVQSSSVTQLCPALCNPMDFSNPDLPVHHQLLELAQTHVH